MKKYLAITACVVMNLIVLQSGIVSAEKRSESQQDYAQSLWDFLNRPGRSFDSWQESNGDLALVSGPQLSGPTIVFLNSLASSAPQEPAPGATIVANHLDPQDDSNVRATTVWVRVPDSHRAADDGWYWVHYTADGDVVKSSAEANAYEKAGFYTQVEDGRLWVFKLGSDALTEFINSGEPAKHVTRPGGGPGGMTIKGADAETIDEYLVSRPGYASRIHDGRLWVFPNRSHELIDFDAGKINEKHVTRPGAGPQGMTVKASTSEDIDGYLAAKPHFAIRVVDGRIWVFKEGSEELTEFDDQGELAKHVTWPAAGPNRVTLKAADDESLQEYVAAKDGFVTIIEDGRIWVFLPNSAELKEFEEIGEPAKCITRPGAGPLQMTVKSVDASTIDAYLSN